MQRATATRLDRQSSDDDRGAAGPAPTPTHAGPNLAAPGVRLGPGEVVAVAADHVDVRLATGEVVPALLALAFLYQPVVGDSALVAGEPGAHYVIGILRGAGRTTLDLPGDVDLRAQGKLRLLSSESIELRAPTVKIASTKLDLLAGAVVQRFQSLRQRVTELVSLHAGESHTVVEGSSHAQSKRATILTQEKVTINGREVHLG